MGSFSNAAGVSAFRALSHPAVGLITSNSRKARVREDSWESSNWLPTSVQANVEANTIFTQDSYISRTWAHKRQSGVPASFVDLLDPEAIRSAARSTIMREYYTCSVTPKAEHVSISKESAQDIVDTVWPASAGAPANADVKAICQRIIANCVGSHTLEDGIKELVEWLTVV